ncbi:hypothetical protein D3C79_799390 [compost metagenome]
MPAGAGIGAVAHAGVAGLEARRGGGDAQVAAQAEVHATAHGGAVDGSDGGLVEAVQAQHQGVGGFGPAVAFQGALGLGRGPFGQVGTGAEAAPAAGQHHHAHGRVAVAGFQQGVQLLEGGDVQRVALLGAVEGDPGNAGFDLAQQ